MNRKELMRKLQRMGEKRVKSPDAGNESEAHNTEPVLYGKECGKARASDKERTEFESKVYRAGRTWLVRIPKVAALNLDLTPGCTTSVSIRVIHREGEKAKS